MLLDRFMTGFRFYDIKYCSKKQAKYFGYLIKTVQHHQQDAFVVSWMFVAWRGCCFLQSPSSRRQYRWREVLHLWPRNGHNRPGVKTRIRQFLKRAAAEAVVRVFLRSCLRAHSGQHCSKMIDAHWLWSDTNYEQELYSQPWFMVIISQLRSRLRDFRYRFYKGSQRIHLQNWDSCSRY